MYLLDTNTIIDFFNSSLPDKGKKLLTSFHPAISVITRIELFSSLNLSNEEKSKLEKFVKVALIYNELNTDIIIKTITIRQKNKIKLPDAIIAATAIANNLTLITRNTKDFNKIEDLKLINPYEM